MNIHAFICTRSTNHSPTTHSLLSYLDRIGAVTHLLVNKASIFSAYAEELKTITDKNDIVIMMHDDIEILSDPETFKEELEQALFDSRCGFVGVAGATKLTQDAVWWNREVWQNQGLRGTVFHGKHRSVMTSTLYGPPGKVVVMDGLFLAAKARTLEDIGLEKPKTFTGDWDFYDIYYTLSAYEKGYYNKVLPIVLRHESVGNLAGRDSWHENRKKLLGLFRLPIECHS